METAPLVKLEDKQEDRTSGMCILLLGTAPPQHTQLGGGGGGGSRDNLGPKNHMMGGFNYLSARCRRNNKRGRAERCDSSRCRVMQRVILGLHTMEKRPGQSDKRE